MDHVYRFDDYLNKISEGLIQTYPISKTIQDIDKLISSYNIPFKIIQLESSFKIELKNIWSIPNFDKILDIILSSLFNQYGWFPSKVRINGIFGNTREYPFNKSYILFNIRNIESCIITFESKFDKVENDIPDKLYHLSIQQYEEDIKQKGLICKGKSKLTRHDFDGRIYLCKNVTNCKVLIPRMQLYYKEEMFDIINNPNNPKGKYNKNTKWIIYEIDTQKADISKLYKDPNFLGGFYYLNNIRKESISIFEKET
jgi:hypothetical protein